VLLVNIDLIEKAKKTNIKNTFVMG
jgi:hypothetical protein